MLELCTMKHAKLSEFLTKCETTGVVSRDEVISLESFIGASLITTHIPTNRFTELESAICLNDTVRIVAKELKNASITDSITYEIFLKKMISLLPEINYIKWLLVELSKINQDVLDRFLNEKFVYSYIGKGNTEKITVINMSKDLGIYETLRWRRDYISAVLDVTTNGMYAFDEIQKQFSAFSDTLDNQADFVVLPLLNTIISGKLNDLFYVAEINLTDITISDMCAVIKDIDTHIDKLVKLEEYVKQDIERYKNEIVFYSQIENDYNYIKKDYDKYCNAFNLLTDLNSVMILKVLTYFADKK